MNAIDLINDLRTELNKVKAQGQAAVSVAALEAYLSALEPVATSNATAPDEERARAKAVHEFEVYKVQAPLQHAAAMEMVKSAIAAGGDALRLLVLINGGAAVALLAFLGNVLTKEAPDRFNFSVQGMRVALATFVFGVGFAGVSAAARYLTQFSASNRWVKTANSFNAVAIIFGVMSLASFFRGGLWAYWALR